MSGIDVVWSEEGVFQSSPKVVVQRAAPGVTAQAAADDSGIAVFPGSRHRGWHREVACNGVVIVVPEHAIAVFDVVESPGHQDWYLALHPPHALRVRVLAGVRECSRHRWAGEPAKLC